MDNRVDAGGLSLLDRISDVLPALGAKLRYGFERIHSQISRSSEGNKLPDGRSTITIYINGHPHKTDASRLSSRQIRELDDPLLRTWYQLWWQKDSNTEWPMTPFDDSDPPDLHEGICFYFLPPATGN
jgi:hypothetical protein